MKPSFTKAINVFDNLVTFRYDEMPNFYPNWHFHEEFELVYIHKSSGIRYIGDNIMPYQPGDLVLLGSFLPHAWINDKTSEGNDNTVAATVIHFQKKFIQNDFFNQTLLDNLRSLFQRSELGILFVGIKEIEPILDKINTSKSTDRIIAVLTLLEKLYIHTEKEYLSPKEYLRIVSGQSNDRFSKIHDYLATNFRKNISLQTLASIANMTPPAFCNYFKRKTTKSVVTYINDLKIGYSCKLLIEHELTIDQVAHESGYNNTTFFNRKFKEKMRFTPKQYRMRYENFNNG